MEDPTYQAALDAGQAPSPVDVAPLAKEIQEFLLRLVEKSLKQREHEAGKPSQDTPSTDWGQGALDMPVLSTEGRQGTFDMLAESTGGWHDALETSRSFFAALLPNDKKAAKTIDLFLAAFCVEGLGCYRRRSITSAAVRDMWVTGNPTLVIKGPSSSTIRRIPWGPSNTFGYELHLFQEHRKAEFERTTNETGLDNLAETGREDSNEKPATLVKYEEIEAWWPKSLCIQNSQLWGNLSSTFYIKCDSDLYPALVTFSPAVCLTNLTFPYAITDYSVYALEGCGNSPEWWVVGKFS